MPREGLAQALRRAAGLARARSGGRQGARPHPHASQGDAAQRWGRPRKWPKKLPASCAFATGPLLPRSAAELSAAAGERITPEMFDLERLPLHLRMKIRVIDQGGKTVVEGRDLLATLREHLGERPAPPSPPAGGLAAGIATD